MGGVVLAMTTTHVNILLKIKISQGSLSVKNN